MIAVLTGDIINSRKISVEQWLPLLKETLEQYGNSPDDWEIYRGDSFQFKTTPENALFAALHLKASLKQIRPIDARLALGIGSQTYKASSISESNGIAYIRSGECFQNLKKNSLGISTGVTTLDQVLNLLFSLALLNIDTWSPVVATAVKTALENPEKNQSEIAEMLNKSQSSLSEALKRGGYDEIIKLEDFYRQQIMNL